MNMRLTRYAPLDLLHSVVHFGYECTVEEWGEADIMPLSERLEEDVKNYRVILCLLNYCNWYMSKCC